MLKPNYDVDEPIWRDTIVKKYGHIAFTLFDSVVGFRNQTFIIESETYSCRDISRIKRQPRLAVRVLMLSKLSLVTYFYADIFVTYSYSDKLTTLGVSHGFLFV